jgi:hypothetical protein
MKMMAISRVRTLWTGRAAYTHSLKDNEEESEKCTAEQKQLYVVECFVLERCIVIVQFEAIYLVGK